MSQAKTFFSCAFNASLYMICRRSSFRDKTMRKGETSSWDEAFPYGDGLIADSKIRREFQWIKCIASVNTFQEITIVT